ncbi:MAG: GumC family protein [Lentilitoribacter sp.]
MRHKRQSLLDLASSSPQNRGQQDVRPNAQNNVKIRSKVRPKAKLKPKAEQKYQKAADDPQLAPNASVLAQDLEDDARATVKSKSSNKFDFFNRDKNVDAPYEKSQAEHADPAPDNSTSYEIDPDKPLLDLFIIVRHMWAKKWLIIACGILGAALGVFVAISTPHKYYADSRLILDPRDVQVTDTVNSNNQASSQVLLAVVDSQMQVARSTSVLERVVEKLRLDQDPEFNGADDAGVLSKLKRLLSSSSQSDDPFENAVTYLRDNMGLARDPETFLVYIGANTNNAEKSALVANTIVEEYLVEYKQQQSGIFAKTTDSIEVRLEELREKLDAAEKRIVDYRSENDIIDVGGGVINEKEMLALSNELAKVRADQVAKSVLANELRNTDIDGVISGSFPQAALTPTLSELRKQYTEAKSKSDSLAVGLGPRHPQYIAAKASADAVATEIKNELTRIVSSTQNDVVRARDSEGQLADKLAVLKTRASNQSTENVGLRELERKAEAIRQIYESLLRRARETTERGNLETSVIQVIAKADPPQHPSTTSRKTTVILFGILGGMLGLAIAFILGSLESLKQHTKTRGSNRQRNYASQSRSGRNDIDGPQNYNDAFDKQIPVRVAHEHRQRTNHDEQPHDYGRPQVTAAQYAENYNPHPMPQYQQPQMPQQNPIYPPQFNPVAIAPHYVAPQAVVPNGYPTQVNPAQQAQWQTTPIAHGYQQPLATNMPNQEQAHGAPTVQTEQPVEQAPIQQSGDREKVMRLKSDVQRLRAELESWAQSRNN